MKAAWHALTVALAIVPVSAALAQPSPDPQHRQEDRHEIALDIDNDGKMDRAVLVQHPKSRNGDLSIYLDAGTGSLDPSRKPVIVKANLTDARINGFESKGKGSLVITYGCGGCSNDYETTLTIIHRGGQFLVAGYAYSWETRDGSGSCDINFLTGKGVMSRNLGKSRPIKGMFAPVALADWSDAKRPKACTR